MPSFDNRVIGVTAIVGVCLFVFGFDATPQPAPMIELQEIEVDKGVVLFNKPLKHAFQIKNTGNAPLEFLTIKTSCGCVSTVLPGKTITAGKSDTIEVGYTPKAERKRLGRQSFTASFITNAPSAPEFTLSVRATLVDYVNVTPTSLNFEIGSGGPPAEKQFTVHCYDDGSPATVTEVLTNSTHISIEMASDTQYDWGREYLYNVSIIPAVSMAAETITVQIHTTSVELPMLELPVKVVPKSCFRANPKALLFGVVSNGKHVEKSVTLSNICGEGGSVPTHVLSEDDRLSVSLESEKSGTDWTIKAEVTGVKAENHKQLRDLKSKIRVLDNTDNILIEIPVVALFTSATQTR